MKKRLPPLGRRSPSPRHILCNGGLSDIDAELEKLAMNPWCAPQRVGETHLANELTDLQRGRWTATARSLFPAPIRSEAGTMPADHGLRPDDLQSVQQAGCQPIQSGKYQTVDAAEGQSPRRFTSHHVELMTKRQDLCLQRRSRPEQSDQRQPNQAANISHQPRASPNSTSLASRIEFPTMTGHDFQRQQQRKPALCPTHECLGPHDCEN